MFFKKNTEEDRPKTEHLSPVGKETLPRKPQPIAPHKGAIPLGTYEQLAKELDYFPAQLLEEQLRRFLAEQNIPVYGLDEVDRYLTKLAVDEGKVWVWRPLREKDRTKYKPVPWGWDGRSNDGRPDPWGHGGHQENWNYRPYDKAVPIHILRQVKKIQDRFGNLVSFFVSDFAVPNPDPFIMVTALDVNRIVFGVWEEPGFGDMSDQISE